MQTNTSATAQKLLQAFMQLNKAGWHPRSVDGYKPSEIRVLFCIKKAGTPALKVSEISKFLHVTSPTVTQLIKGLEASRLIERTIDTTDRRAVDIKLTEKGEMVTGKAREAILASFEELIEYLGEADSNQLADLLFRVFMYFNTKEDMIHWSGDEEA